MKRFICAVLLTIVAIAPATAKILKKIPPELASTKAYILIEYKLAPNPYADLPGSPSTMPLRDGLSLARYDPVLGDIRGRGKAKENPVPEKQKSIELFSNQPLVKTDKARLFLLEVEPDTWVIQGWGTTSFALGSYAFKLEPGTITDLGVVMGTHDWAEDQRVATVGEVFKSAMFGPFAKKPDIAPMRATFWERGPEDIALPNTLPLDRIRKVTFIPDAKFGNYLGGLVNRIDGVNQRLKAAPDRTETPSAPPAETKLTN